MELTSFLRQAQTIAVLGAHPQPDKAAHFVPNYLHRQGYRLFPVNPAFVGQELWGQPVLERLDHITQPIDILNVFRRPEVLPAHLSEMLALKPKMVWLQSGIEHADVAKALQAAGIAVVQDRCLMVVHRQLVGATP